MIVLSDAEKALVAAVATYRTRRPYGPSVRDLCELLGYRSTGQVSYHVNKLVYLGVLLKDRKVARSLRVNGDVSWT